MKVLTGLFLSLNIAFFLVVVYVVGTRGYIPVTAMTSVEVVTIVLGALGVMLTALGIFIAVLAILGYTAIQNLAVERAEGAAQKSAAETARQEVAQRVPGLVAAQMALLGSGGDYGAAAAAAGDDNDVRNEPPHGN